LDSPNLTAPGSQADSVANTPDIASPAARLDESLAGSLAWRALANWTSQIVTWAAFLVVARLLSPADFGIVSMAAILYSYLKYVGEFGIPTVVVTLRDLTEDQLAQLNGIAVLLGLLALGASCALAYPVAIFFKTPRLVAVVVVTCLALVALGLRAVPEGLLSKDLRFRWLSLVDGGCDVLAAAITLLMAFRGFAYWSLVVGNLVAAAARSALIVNARPHRFALPRLRSIRKELIFGWHVLVSILSWNSYTSLDNVTAGRVLGPSALGFYGMAWNLANVPLEKVTSLVTTIIPSYLSTVQTEPAALRRYVRGLTELMALATFPATVGLALVGCELIPIALGYKWKPMVPALEILCAYAAVRSLVALLDKVLTAVGKTRFVMWDQLWALVLMPSAFYLGSRWGIAGIAWGWVAAYPLVALPLYWKTFKTIHMKFGEYFRALRPALDGTAVMILGVLGLKWVLPAGQPLLLRLILEVAVGGAAYIGTVLLLHRQRALAFYNMALRLRRAAV